MGVVSSICKVNIIVKVTTQCQGHLKAAAPQGHLKDTWVKGQSGEIKYCKIGLRFVQLNLYND